MLFAVVDCVHYCMRIGRFARGNPRSFMGAAFQDRLPENVVSELRPGDLLFVGAYDSFLSWLIMYFTNSEVSHLAIYNGSRKIVHGIPPHGAVEEPIERLFRPYIRILPCLLNISEQDREEMKSHAEESVRFSRGYDWGLTLRTGWQIMMGFHYRSFRWSLLPDIFLSLLLLDSPLLVHFGHPVLLWSFALYLPVVVLNLAGTWLWPAGLSDESATFLDIFAAARERGARLITDKTVVKEPPKWPKKFPDLSNLSRRERERRFVKRKMKEWLVVLLMFMVLCLIVALAIGAAVWIGIHYGLRVISVVVGIIALIPVVVYFVRRLCFPPTASVEAGQKALERGNFDLAVWHWRTLADRGNADAQTRLGHLYGPGRLDYLYSKHPADAFLLIWKGFKPNWADAEKWWLHAAEQGQIEAMYFLGLMYWEGDGLRDGVPRDLVRAYVWLARAKKRGHPKAAGSLERLSKEMTGPQICEAKQLLQE